MKHPDPRLTQVWPKDAPYVPLSLEVARAMRPLRLNLGCANVGLREYVNVDALATTFTDLICSMDEEPLPFDTDSVDEIFMAHLLEHIRHTHLDWENSPQTKAIREWKRVLKPGGRIQIVGPNFEFLGAELIRASKIIAEPFDPEGIAPREMDPFTHYANCVVTVMSAPFYGEDHIWCDRFMHHWWILTGNYVCELLRRHGFREPESDPDWPKTEFSVEAWK